MTWVTIWAKFKTQGPDPCLGWHEWRPIVSGPIGEDGVIDVLVPAMPIDLANTANLLELRVKVTDERPAHLTDALR